MSFERTRPADVILTIHGKNALGKRGLGSPERLGDAIDIEPNMFLFQNECFSLTIIGDETGEPSLG